MPRLRGKHGFLKNIILFMYFYLGLSLCCSLLFSSCMQGPVLCLLCAGFSLRWLSVVRTGLEAVGLCSGGAQALEHRLRSCGTGLSCSEAWSLPNPEIKLRAASELASRLFTTGADCGSGPDLGFLTWPFPSFGLSFLMICKKGLKMPAFPSYHGSAVVPPQVWLYRVCELVSVSPCG